MLGSGMHCRPFARRASVYVVVFSLLRSLSSIPGSFFFVLFLNRNPISIITNGNTDTRLIDRALSETSALRCTIWNGSYPYVMKCVRLSQLAAMLPYPPLGNSCARTTDDQADVLFWKLLLETNAPADVSVDVCFSSFH